MRVISSGAVPGKYSVHTIAIYDRTDGRVYHMHHIVLFDGAEMPQLREIEEDAVKTVAARGVERSRIEILNAGTQSLDFDARYRVDLAKKSLVKLVEQKRYYRGGTHLSNLRRGRELRSPCAIRSGHHNV